MTMNPVRSIRLDLRGIQRSHVELFIKISKQRFDLTG